MFYSQAQYVEEPWAKNMCMPLLKVFQSVYN